MFCRPLFSRMDFQLFLRAVDAVVKSHLGVLQGDLPIALAVRDQNRALDPVKNSSERELIGDLEPFLDRAGSGGPHKVIPEVGNWLAGLAVLKSHALDRTPVIV